MPDTDTVKNTQYDRKEMTILVKTKTVVMTTDLISNNIPEIRYLELPFIHIGLHIGDEK